MSRWMWQATASVVRDLIKSGHTKAGAALYALALVCSLAAIVTMALAGGKAVTSTIEAAKGQPEHKGGVSIAPH
ncbi:hypothetical protein CVN68_14215 [Sphingomonas psychrotolerans]|uniref:Uncharacterized protein n=1 Tax=Sphingomonas psychrotolerans TaxID=1327635 RepID=A0A2K8MGJ0_9SPHN|nr:hypothetical protein CVN68_14215 [Sphingomonas psychrotolerans]